MALYHTDIAVSARKDNRVDDNRLGIVVLSRCCCALTIALVVASLGIPSVSIRIPSIKIASLKTSPLGGRLLGAWYEKTAVAKDTREDIETKLEKIQHDLDKKRKSEATLAKTNTTINSQLSQLQRKQITIAQDIRYQERKVLSYQQSMTELRQQQVNLSSYLKEHAHQYLQQASAMHHIYQQSQLPFVRLTNPLMAVRSVMVLKRTLPLVQNRMRVYIDGVTRTRKHEAQVAEQLYQVKIATDMLNQNQQKLAQSLQEKQRLLKLTSQDWQQLQASVGTLQTQVTSLQDLIKTLQPLVTPKKRLDTQGTSKKNTDVRVAVATPTLPSSQAQGAHRGAHRGAQSRQWALKALTTRPDGVRRFPVNSTIHSPVVGTVLVQYGDVRNGVKAEGTIFSSLPKATVVATFDGRIAFASPFGSLGNVVVIEHDGSFHTVLRGLARINVVQGQWVFAGEPVGVTSTNSDNAELYVELRNKGKPVNPMRWLPRTLAINAVN